MQNLKPPFIKSWIWILTFLIGAYSVQAQIKIGSNPTTITTNKNLEIEASNGKKVNINKDDGRTFVENTPTAALTDSLILKYTDGELRQMSVAKFLKFAYDSQDLDNDGIPNGTDPDIDGDGVLNATDKCPMQWGCSGYDPVGCPSACNIVPKTQPSSNGTAVITSFDNCSAGTAGTLTQGTAASGVTQTLSVTVGTAGTYAISASANGVTFSGSGTLAVGTQTIVLTASGTPSTSGTATFTINTSPSCSFTRTLASSSAIASLDCSGATNAGTLTQGLAASGVTSTIAYTGGNGSSYAAQTISSTGVTGLTATLTAGTFATGNGTLVYTITGTPSGLGTASFAINIGGKSCTLTRTVAFALQGSGFETATGCVVNGTLAQVNALFPTIYKGYNSPYNTTGPFNIDIFGDCDATYGSAWSGTKFIALTSGDAITIDLGADLTPGTQFSMVMYEKASGTYSPATYNVGLSSSPGVSGSSSTNQLFTSTGTTNTTWTAKTISFTVPSGTGLRYLTLECTSSNTTWTHLDF